MSTDPGKPDQAPDAVVCAICQWPLEEDEETTRCPECQASYHQECWADNQGCAVYGCEQVPATETLRSVEIPLSYWGQERKECPNCEEPIQAAAIRCRHCASIFPSAKPMTKEEYDSHVRQTARLPRVRTVGMVLFSACLVPVLSTLAMDLAIVWYLLKQKDLRALPASDRSLLAVGISVGALQTIVYGLVAVIYLAAFRI